MAIINCPECGGQISSTAKQCVHCGCKITVCSECGKVTLGESHTCPNCGYEIVKNHLNNEDKSYENINAVIHEYNRENPLLNIIGNGIFRFILLSASFILFIWAITSLIIWKSGPAENVLESKSVLSTAKNLCIISLLLFILYSAFNKLFETLNINLFSSWVKINNIDLYHYIDKTLNNTCVKKLDLKPLLTLSQNFGRAVSSLQYSSDIQAKTNAQTHAIIKWILSSISALMAHLFVVKNIENFINAIIWYGEFSFEIIDNYVFLFLGILFFVIAWIISKIFDKQDHAKTSSWMKKNLYDKYTPEVQAKLSNNGWEIYK